MGWREYFNQVIAPEIRLVGIIVAACLLISTTGIPFVWLIALAFLAFSAFHIYQSKLLLTWLSQEELASPSDNLRGIWYEIAIDIHRRNKLTRTKAIQQQQLIEQFRTVNTALPDGMIILDELNHIEWLNTRAESLLGLRADQDIGSNITNLVRDPNFVDFYNQGEQGESLRLRSPADSKIRLDLRLISYDRKHLLIIQDFTRLHHIEQVHQDFVANVSHELRTPLSVVAGYIEMLDNDKAPELETYRPTFWQMKQQSDRMTRLVEDLLVLSNLENNRQVNRRAEVDVPDMLAGIRDDALILSGDKAQSIILDADETLWLEGNARELQGLFSNLVSNAVNYTPAQGTIKMRWYVNNNHGVMEVEDNGIGIEPQHINRLTERFYRVDKGRSRDTGGTGLGLAIVKHALQRHDAKLVIKSKPGVGSTFKCLFPLERCLRESEHPEWLNEPDEAPSTHT
ncbi:MAG: phosphate regulon sensor histidine kinase PhoR [Proteobacteria bacterium]|nr:MAG: phosphate regulon sensor histidine kinase PhoR [Pseudomonadota bacterium]